MLGDLKVGDPEGLMSPYSGQEVHKLVVEAAKATGLKELYIVPYSARHCGASSDKASGVRSLVEVQRRGRWKCMTSVARYEMAARINEQLNLLPPQVRAEAVAAEKNIAKILA